MFKWSTYVGRIPEFVSSLLAEFVKFNFFWKNVQRDVYGASEASPALVVVQYCVERRSVPIEKIFVPETNVTSTSCINILRVPVCLSENKQTLPMTYDRIAIGDSFPGLVGKPKDKILTIHMKAS